MNNEQFFTFNFQKMKTKISIILFCFVTSFIVFSCGQVKTQVQTTNDKPINIEKGVVVNKIVCKSDSTLSYAVYLPSTYISSNKYPVIYFFDPHGSGYLPLKKYKALAEKHNYIFVGSNNSKNGLDWNVIINIVQAMMNDSQEKLSVDKDKIYTAGFSGGAKIAGIICALNPQFKGVIGCGAPFPFTQDIANAKFDYIGLAGEEDFNLNSMKDLDRQLYGTQINHKLVIFNGKHEWPPENLINEAFIWLQNPLTPEGKSELSPEDAAKKFKEQQMMSYYANAITMQDLSWWKKEVKKMNAEIKEGTDKETVLMKKRVMNYLGLLAYMQVSNVINSNNTKAIENLLEVYSLVDPENSEPRYLFAKINAKKGETQKALNYLKEAVKLKFDDLNRLQKDDFFKPLKDNKEFNDIIMVVKTNKTQN